MRSRKRRPNKCMECDSPLEQPASGIRKTCLRCSKVRYRAKQKSWWKKNRTIRLIKCIVCLRTFEGRAGKQLTCCAECSLKLKKIRGRDWCKANRDHINNSHRIYMRRRPATPAQRELRKASAKQRYKNNREKLIRQNRDRRFQDRILANAYRQFMQQAGEAP